jgi:hypothetical protein
LNEVSEFMELPLTADRTFNSQSIALSLSILYNYTDFWGRGVDGTGV